MTPSAAAKMPHARCTGQLLAKPAKTRNNAGSCECGGRECLVNFLQRERDVARVLPALGWVLGETRDDKTRERRRGEWLTSTERNRSSCRIAARSAAGDSATNARVPVRSTQSMPTRRGPCGQHPPRHPAAAPAPWYGSVPKFESSGDPATSVGRAT